MKKGKKTLPWQRLKTNEFDGRVFLIAQIKTKLSVCLRNYKTKNGINNEEKMKAININTDKSLSIIEVDKPIIKENEVLIKTSFAALNRADLLQREGSYPSPDGWPDRMGLEVSGVIEQVGEQVTDINIGDRVCALLGGGGYSEYVAVPKELVVVVSGMSLDVACCIPETYCTAYLNLFLEGNLKKEETVLVHAGASGVGIAVIQLAKLFGAKVIATVRSNSKAKAIEDLGADLIVNSKETNIERLFEQMPIDLVIDCVGGLSAGKCFTKMNSGGRWIVIATLGGDITEINLKEVYKKGVRLIGSTLRSRTNEVKGRILNMLKTEVFPKIINGEITPVIYKIFDFCDVELAHREMQNNKNVGKILLRI